MSVMEIVRAALSVGGHLGLIVLALIGAHVAIFGRGEKR